MPSGFSKFQQHALKRDFVSSDNEMVPLESLDLSSLSGSELQLAFDARYLKLSQSSNFATAVQGSLAETALQPGDSIGNDIAGVPAATLVSDTASALSLAQLVYGWGNHAAAGYVTTIPYLRVYQAVAAGGAPETFTLPATPYLGSDIMVFVEQLPKHKELSDPPAAGNFYVSGTTVKVDTTALDRVSIYYMA